MNSKLRTGVYTLMPIPYTNNNNIDLRSISRWLDFQYKSNVTGLIIFGIPSELELISVKDCNFIVDHLYDEIKKYPNSKEIIFGIKGDTLEEIIDQARDIMVNIWCDGFVVTVPNNMTQDEIVNYFVKFCSEIKHHSIIISNENSILDTKTICEICDKCDNVAAIKETSITLDRIIDLAGIDKHIQLFASDDKTVLDVMLHGGCGVMSTASNVIPDIICNIVNLCDEQDFADATTQYHSYDLGNFFEALKCKENTLPVKYMLYCRKIFDTFSSESPTVCLTEEKKDHIKNMLELVLNKNCYVKISF